MRRVKDAPDEFVLFGLVSIIFMLYLYSNNKKKDPSCRPPCHSCSMSKTPFRCWCEYYLIQH